MYVGISPMKLKQRWRARSDSDSHSRALIVSLVQASPVVFLQGHRGAHRLDHLRAVPPGELSQGGFQPRDQLSAVQQPLNFLRPYDNRRPGHRGKQPAASGEDSSLLSSVQSSSRCLTAPVLHSRAAGGQQAL